MYIYTPHTSYTCACTHIQSAYTETVASATSPERSTTRWLLSPRVRCHSSWSSRSGFLTGEAESLPMTQCMGVRTSAVPVWQQKSCRAPGEPLVLSQPGPSISQGVSSGVGQWSEQGTVILLFGSLSRLLPEGTSHT